MSASTAKTVELSFESTNSFDDALQAGIERTCKRMERVKQLWIKDQEVILNNGTVAAYRIHAKVTFEVAD